MIRSEADELLFQHAGSSGAHIFDATKVDGISFERGDDVHALDPGRPVSATWSRKDGTSGTITFDYVVDASGRRGLLSTKYLKNRKFNDNLKSLASWGYWKGGGVHGKGTYKEGVPFFEALEGNFKTVHRTLLLKIAAKLSMLTMEEQMEVGGAGSSPYTMARIPLASSSTNR